MLQAHIEIDSDNDFDVYSPIGVFHAYGPELKHSIQAVSEDELRKAVVWFLAQLEIRKPYEQEYNSDSLSGRGIGHDLEFKLTIYEAMHQIASGGNFGFHTYGNRQLHVGLV